MTQVDTNQDLDPDLDPTPTSTATIDLYREVHKGARRALFGLCEAAGTLDPADTTARDAFVGRFADLDVLLTLHHEHEDGEFFGNLIDRVAPQFTNELHAAHVKAVDDLASVRSAVIALGDGGGNAEGLYDLVASFVVDYLAHMAFEEHHVMPALAAGATFDELLAVQIGIRTAMPPSDMVRFMRSMLPAMNTDERTNMLGGMKAGAPAEIFDIFWSTAADVLTTDQLAVVAGRIGADPSAVAR